jgi:lysylphosphatidylglycerol synthase-like protein
MSSSTDDQPPTGSEPDTEAEEAQARRRLRNGLISLALLVVLAAGLLLAVPGLHSVGRVVAHMQASWLAAAVGLEILSCLGYVLAFLQVFERAPIRFGARVALTELAFNSAVSLGGAASQGIGVWLLVERGAPAGRATQRAAVLFLLTTAVNVITLVLTGLALYVGLLPGPQRPLLSIVPAAIGAAGFIVVVLLPPVMQRMAGAQDPGRIRTLLTVAAATIRDTERLLFGGDWRTLGAIGYLWFDIGVLIACFAAIGKVPPLASIVLAYQIGYLANFVPVPGGIGVLDAGLVGMLVLYGVNATDATAATIVYHAIALWIPAMWGTIAFLVLRRSRGKPLKLRPTRAERRQARTERREQG